MAAADIISWTSPLRDVNVPFITYHKCVWIIFYSHLKPYPDQIMAVSIDVHTKNVNMIWIHFSDIKSLELE